MSEPQSDSEHIPGNMKVVIMDNIYISSPLGDKCRYLMYKRNGPSFAPKNIAEM